MKSCKTKINISLRRTKKFFFGSHLFRDLFDFFLVSDIRRRRSRLFVRLGNFELAAKRLEDEDVPPIDVLATDRGGSDFEVRFLPPADDIGLLFGFSLKSCRGKIIIIC